MKIAVLLFGHVRSYQYCSRYLKKNVLNRYHADVFMHTWDLSDSQTLTWDNRKRNISKITSEELTKIKKIYLPKGFCVESQHIEEDEILKSKIDGKKASLQGMRHAFLSLKRANDLRKKYEKEKGIKYDLILVTRPDIAIYKEVPIEKSIQEARMLNLDLETCRFFAGLSNVSKANCALMVHRGCDMLFWGKEVAIENFILANTSLSYEYAVSHFYNVTSILTSNEIRVGNNPQLVCFQYGKDWKVVREVSDTEPKKSSLCKFLHLCLFFWEKKWSHALTCLIKLN